ncbi:hypothetical protein M9H77_16653 [Catharanthus roseus]|uniref:Uncharacterized protein n=1 Tax=Catharanthus roseus TaxID=4058 RepID=A0ACC0B2C3_CATRO|nr:hypothetical protein M9H77_16653 [Catharanthus roseus]
MEEDRRWMYRRTVVMGVISEFQLVYNRIKDAFSKFNKSDIQTRISGGFHRDVRESKKKRAHPEMFTGPSTTSTPPALASIPQGTSTSPTTMSTSPTSASIPLGTSTPPATLTAFSQLSYSSLAPISNPSSSSSDVVTSSRPSPSSLGPLVPPV